MDRRERQRLEDEIDRGTLNAGIHKLEDGAYERESRLPVVKGGTAGLALSAPVAYYYGNHVDIHHLSPLGLFSDDYVVVMLGIIVSGTLLGAAIAWVASRRVKL